MNLKYMDMFTCKQTCFIINTNNACYHYFVIKQIICKIKFHITVSTVFVCLLFVFVNTYLHTNIYTCTHAHTRMDTYIYTNTHT